MWGNWESEIFINGSYFLLPFFSIWDFVHLLLSSICTLLLQGTILSLRTLISVIFFGGIQAGEKGFPQLLLLCLGWVFGLRTVTIWEICESPDSFGGYWNKGKVDSWYYSLPLSPFLFPRKKISDLSHYQPEIVSLILIILKEVILILLPRISLSLLSVSRAHLIRAFQRS